ncbi:unnamed protein product [Phytophthora lilii]|uniref:Unnamed protein product n=1 Tax=Phytophthora lilii TaxID=2077276 RepID=A0A9W6U8Z2_9STRA|nr:unnamed protein product [Phytophthora lilii]
MCRSTNCPFKPFDAPILNRHKAELRLVQQPEPEAPVFAISRPTLFGGREEFILQYPARLEQPTKRDIARHRFTVCHGKKRRSFQAPDAATFDAWLSALEQALEPKRESEHFPTPSTTTSNATTAASSQGRVSTAGSTGTRASSRGRAGTIGSNASSQRSHASVARAPPMRLTLERKGITRDPNNAKLIRLHHPSPTLYEARTGAEDDKLNVHAYFYDLEMESAMVDEFSVDVGLAVENDKENGGVQVVDAAATTVNELNRVDDSDDVAQDVTLFNGIDLGASFNETSNINLEPAVEDLDSEKPDIDPEVTNENQDSGSDTFDVIRVENTTLVSGGVGLVVNVEAMDASASDNALASDVSSEQASNPHSPANGDSLTADVIVIADVAETTSFHENVGNASHVEVNEVTVCGTEDIEVLETAVSAEDSWISTTYGSIEVSEIPAVEDICAEVRNVVQGLVSTVANTMEKDSEAGPVSAYQEVGDIEPEVKHAVEAPVVQNDDRCENNEMSGIITDINNRKDDVDILPEVTSAVAALIAAVIKAEADTKTDVSSLDVIAAFPKKQSVSVNSSRSATLVTKHKWIPLDPSNSSLIWVRCSVEADVKSAPRSNPRRKPIKPARRWVPIDPSSTRLIWIRRVENAAARMESRYKATAHTRTWVPLDPDNSRYIWVRRQVVPMGSVTTPMVDRSSSRLYRHGRH